MHPFAEGNVAAAQRDIRKCIEALEAAVRGQRADFHAAEALGLAYQVASQLEDARAIDEMAVTAGGDEA
jgi:hypothetical protein